MAQLRKESAERLRAPETVEPKRLAWTIEETAIACAVSPSLVTRAIREGKLRSCVLGPQTIRVLPEDALEWLHAYRFRSGAITVSDKPSGASKKKTGRKASAKKSGKLSAPAMPTEESDEVLADLDWVLERGRGLRPKL